MIFELILKTFQLRLIDKNESCFSMTLTIGIKTKLQII